MRDDCLTLLLFRLKCKRRRNRKEKRRRNSSERGSSKSVFVCCLRGQGLRRWVVFQADNARTAILAAASSKAGDKVRHAKHVSKMRRLNEERDTELKRSCLLVKLQTAADRRHEVCTVRVAVNAEKSETQFLKRQATTREKLRRSGSSRLLQNVWLSFRDSNRTTKELAVAVLKTSITFLSPSLDDKEALETPSGNLTKAELKDPFEEFAAHLQSEETITAVKVASKNLIKPFGVICCWMLGILESCQDEAAGKKQRSA